MDLGPGAWRTILYHWISASTRIWERRKTELFGVILQPRTHSGMEFANDNDDDDNNDDDNDDDDNDDAIYDSEHRFKWNTFFV